MLTSPAERLAAWRDLTVIVAGALLIGLVVGFFVLVLVNLARADDIADLLATRHAKGIARASGNPARCGRLFMWELEHSARGRTLQIDAPALGCGDMILPAAYRVEPLDAETNRIWRGPIHIADLVMPRRVPPPPPVAVTVIDKRPLPSPDPPPAREFQERREAGALIIDVGRRRP